jgi:hypothetical protein
MVLNSDMHHCTLTDQIRLMSCGVCLSVRCAVEFEAVWCNWKHPQKACALLLTIAPAKSWVSPQPLFPQPMVLSPSY